jgi:hypothetical protein
VRFSCSKTSSFVQTGSFPHYKSQHWPIHFFKNYCYVSPFSAWIFIAQNSQSRQNRTVINMDMSWMLKVILKILSGLFFWDIKQAVYSLTFSFNGIFKKVTLPVSEWVGIQELWKFSHRRLCGKPVSNPYVLSLGVAQLPKGTLSRDFRPSFFSSNNPL